MISRISLGRTYAFCACCSFNLQINCMFNDIHIQVCVYLKHIILKFSAEDLFQVVMRIYYTIWNAGRELTKCMCVRFCNCECKMATIFVLLEINYLSQMERDEDGRSRMRGRTTGRERETEHSGFSHGNIVFTWFCNIRNYAGKTENECGIQLFNINNNLCRAKCIHILRWKKSKCPLFTLSFARRLKCKHWITCTQFRDKNTHKIVLFFIIHLGSEVIRCLASIYTRIWYENLWKSCHKWIFCKISKVRIHRFN